MSHASFFPKVSLSLPHAVARWGLVKKGTSPRGYRRGWVMAFFLCVGALISTNSFSTILAASTPPSSSTLKTVPKGVDSVRSMQTGTHAHAANATCSTLCYYLGPVQHHPKIYLLFWGSAWNTDQYSVIPAMVHLFGNLAGGDYSNILSQYADGSGPISNDTSLKNTSQGTPYFIDTTSVPAHLDTATIAREATDGLTRAGGGFGPDTQILVFPEQGSSYDPGDNTIMTGCGFHSVDRTSGTNVFYGWVDFAAPTSIDPNSHGCDISLMTTDIPKAMTMYASHEYADMATDPMGDDTGWSKGGPGTGNTEIGDLCNGKGSIYDPANHVMSTVQLLDSVASNGKSNGCIAFLGMNYASPLPPGQHTVQGNILTEYQSSYNEPPFTTVLQLLGGPLAEQMLISGGTVSYFAGQPCGPSGPYGSGGAIYNQGSQAAYEVHGCIYARYQATCQQVSGPCVNLLGLPVTSEEAIAGGRVSYFAGQVCNGGYVVQDEHGTSQVSGSAIYHNGAANYEVHGCIYQKYTSSQNGPNGRLGFPVSDEYTNAAGNRESDFQGGNIQVVNGVVLVQYAPRCVNLAAVYGIHSNGDLLWYGNTDPTGGSRSWASGSGNVVGNGWWNSTFFSGGNGVVYDIHSDGTLWWNKHLGASNGTFSWQGSKQVGSGWFFTSVFSGGNGIIYAVDNTGTLHWYRHLGFTDGTWSWASGSGTPIGNGWEPSSTGIESVFSGGGGIIYAVHTDGTLHWYNHLGFLSGSASWASGSGNTIGSGWGSLNGGVYDSFSAGGGIIFSIRLDGTLEWFDDLGYQSGVADWANGGQGKAIGNGWTTLFGPFADVDACH